MAEVEARQAKVRRNLVSMLSWTLIGGSALVLVVRVLTGQQEEEQRVQVAAQRRQEALDARTITPEEIARLMDGQAVAPVTAGQPAGVGAQPALRLPAGTPPGAPGAPYGGAMAGGDAQDMPEDAEGERLRAARAILAQARASDLAAYEDAGYAGDASVAPPAAPQGFDALGQLAKLLPAGSQGSGAVAANPAGLDPMTLARALQGGKPEIGTATQSNLAWLGQQAQAEDEPPLMPRGRVAEYMLHEGAVIPITLIRAANSDLPGRIKAMVTRDVYDDVHGRYLVIPKGSKVDLVYNGEVAMGQSRILIAATRMTFRTGATLRLASAEIADRTGAVGAPADVDNHFFEIFGSSLLIGAVSAAAPAEASNVSVNVGGGSGGGAAGQILAETSKRVLDRYQNIKPTLSLPAGESLLLVTSRDMVLPPALTGGRAVY